MIIVAAIIAAYVLFVQDKGEKTADKAAMEENKKITSQVDEKEKDKTQTDKTQTESDAQEDLVNQMMNGDFSGMRETDREIVKMMLDEK